MGQVIDDLGALGVEVFTSEDNREDVPGMDWDLSEATQAAIRKIDSSIRAAEELGNSFLVGGC